MSTPPDAPDGRGEGGRDERDRAENGREAARKSSIGQLGPAYQGTLEAVGAVVVALGLGALADSYFESSPVGLLVGLGIGFGSFVLRLTRLLKELTPDPDGDVDGPRGASRDATRETREKRETRETEGSDR